MNQVRYSRRDRETESEVKEGVYRFRIEDQSYYGVLLDSIPDKYTEDLREDFKAASVLINSIENLNLPEAVLDSDSSREVFITQDKGNGKSEEEISFYQAAAFYLLISKNDVKGNIVEGKEGYAPIDFDAVLRSKITDKKYYLKYGAEVESDVELHEYARFNIEKEAERHNIEYNPEKLDDAAKDVATILFPLVEELRRKDFQQRANNLEYNINQIRNYT